MIGDVDVLDHAVLHVDASVAAQPRLDRLPLLAGTRELEVGVEFSFDALLGARRLTRQQALQIHGADRRAEVELRIVGLAHVVASAARVAAVEGAQIELGQRGDLLAQIEIRGEVAVIEVS